MTVCYASSNIMVISKIKKTFIYKELHAFNQVFTPGELIQIDIEKNFERMIGRPVSSIKNIIVVGAWRGNEVASFLRYSNAMIYCFEPNESNFNHLVDRWGSNKRVVCFKMACAAFDGESVLNEASLTGNDSLLSISEDSTTGLKLVKTHKINTVRLDSMKELKNKDIDLLWADTQGYELEVLAGGPELLRRTKSLFLEVYRNNTDYLGGAQYDNVITFLDERGFYLAAEGLDKNIGGNAYFIKKSIDTEAFFEEVYNARISSSLKEVSAKKRILKFKLVQILVVYTPVRIKTFLRRSLHALGITL